MTLKFQFVHNFDQLPNFLQFKHNFEPVTAFHSNDLSFISLQIHEIPISLRVHQREAEHQRRTPGRHRRQQARGSPQQLWALPGHRVLPEELPPPAATDVQPPLAPGPDAGAPPHERTRAAPVFLGPGQRVLAPPAVLLHAPAAQQRPPATQPGTHAGERDLQQSRTIFRYVLLFC